MQISVLSTTILERENKFYLNTMFTLCLRKKMYKYLLLCISLLFLGSCEDESNTYEVGSSWMDADSKIVMIDTLTMKMSTIMMDSVITSGKSVMMIGNIKDQTFGQVSSSSLLNLLLQAIH